MTAPKVFATSYFAVELDSVSVAEFTEISGLQSEIETMTWEEGGNNGFVHVLPVRAKWSNLTLKRGVADHTLWTWYNACARGTVQRRGLAITLYSFSKSGDVFASLRWNITGALPVKWIGPSFKTGASEIAFESIELAHQGFEQVTGGQ